MTPVTQIKQGDTCKGCPWLKKGDKNGDGLINYGCKFYHSFVGFSKSFPTRLPHCDMDGRISQKKYLEKRNQSTTETTTTEEQHEDEA